MSVLNLAYVLYTHLHFLIFFPVVNTYCASSLKRSFEISKIAYFLIFDSLTGLRSPRGWIGEGEVQW